MSTPKRLKNRYLQSITATKTKNQSEINDGPKSVAEHERRRAVVHIGPPKTATSTLQFAMKKDVEIFAQDGYYAKGPFHEFPMCLDTEYKFHSDRCPPQTWEVVTNSLHDAIKNYKHLFISSECFGTQRDVVPRLKSALAPWQDVTIVITYRRFYEWLVSSYNQHFKAFDEPLTRTTGMYPSIVEYFSPKQIYSQYHTLYIPNKFDTYSQYFKDVRVFNNHDTKDFVSDFYCNMIPSATRACQNAQKRASEGVQFSDLNASVLLDYDRLVRAAYQKGLLHLTVEYEHGHGQMTLSAAIRATVRQQEVVLGKTVRDFPQECVSKDTFDLILRLSLKVERMFFPDFFGSEKGGKNLQAHFQSVGKRKFCNLDVESVLSNKEWISFFRLLNKPTESS